MSYYNPFSGIFETNYYPHARTLRSNLRRKLIDTFNVFYGKNINGNAQLGLFDYATLMIPRTISEYADKFDKQLRNKISTYVGSKLTAKSNHPAVHRNHVIPTKTISNIIANSVIMITSLPIRGALTITRAATSAAATLIVSPFVAGVHFLSKIKNGLVEKKFSSTLINLRPRKDDPPNLERLTTLRNYLNNNDEKVHVDFNGTYKKCTLVFHKTSNTPSKTQDEGTVEFDLGNPEQRAALNSMLELNVGGVAADLEKAGANLKFFTIEPPTQEQDRKFNTVASHCKK